MMVPGLSLQTGFIIVAGLTSDQTEIRVANAHGMTLDDEACWTWYGYGLMLCRCLSRSTDSGGGVSQSHAGYTMALTTTEDPSHALLVYRLSGGLHGSTMSISQPLSMTVWLPKVWLLLNTSTHIR